MKSDLFTSCRDFIDLVDQGKSDAQEENEQHLRMLLDMLATFVGKVEIISHNLEAPDPPMIDYKIRRRKAQDRFPNYGYYNTPGRITEDIGTSSTCVGDAIDDIADIYGDLSEVIWLVPQITIDGPLRPKFSQLAVCLPIYPSR